MAPRRQPQEQRCELIIRQFNNGRLDPTQKAFESLGGDACPVVTNDLWSERWNRSASSSVRHHYTGLIQPQGLR